MLLVSPRRPSVARLAVLPIALALAACDSGGGGGGPTQASVQWARARRNSANSAVGGILRENNGAPAHPAIDLMSYGVTASTPLIANDDTLYLGTETGLLIRDPDGTLRTFESCVISGAPTPVNVGPISGTPALTFDKDLVVADDSGRIFNIRDHGSRMDIECRWTRMPSGTDALPILASPLLLTDAFDRTISTVFVTTAEGRLHAYNGDGTDQWRYPSSGTVGSAPSSAATVDAATIYFTAADGFLYALDTAGRLRWRTDVGATPEGDQLASPAVGPSVYAVGVTDGISHVTAVSPSGQPRWRYEADHHVFGSPAYSLQTLEEPLPPTPAPTAPDPIGGDPTPTPTPRMVNVFDTVVYVVDQDATVYGIRDSTGRPFDAVPDDDATPTHTGGPATGTPVPKPAKVALNIAPDRVTTSPTLSSDLFVVFGTANGRVYAVRLDFDRSRPCEEDDDCDENQWDQNDDNPVGGWVDLFPDNPDPDQPRTVLTSPVIDRDGRIYVTSGDLATGKGLLHVIGPP